MGKAATSDIIKEICEQKDAILSNIKRESIDVYLFLKNEYKKGDIKNNTIFQFVFRSYYRLDNAGLTDKFKKRYFELLADKQKDLKTILLELYKLPTLRNINAVQFSFTTKLLHTLDNNKPIFDAEVAHVFYKRVMGNDKDSKIESCVNIYKYLIEIYPSLIKDNKLREIISKFRLKFDVSAEKITDIKVLDFIVWSLGKLKKGKIKKDA